MVRKTIVHPVLVLAALACLAPASALAQPADHRTFFTVSAPIELPGVALPAGTYLFRIANPDTSANVVQVASVDGMKHYGLFLTLNAERPTASSEPELRFMETPAGVPPAVRTWWFEGDRSGREFIYPKEQARRLANNASEPVLTTARETKTADQTTSTDLVRINARGQETKVADGAKAASAEPRGTSQAGASAPDSVKVTAAQMPAGWSTGETRGTTGEKK